MRKIYKQILAIILTMTIVFGMMPQTAMVANANETEGVDINYFKGKKVSILSHSASTYAGVSNDAAANSTIGNNDVYYTEGRHNVYLKDTWWMQIIDALDMKLLVNNSWSGSCVFMPRKGEASVGYGDRAVNLHNDYTGEAPDVIFVYLGCNDFAYYKETFGKADDVDYSALIQEKEDGTFTYANPQNTCEAYGIMLHKVENRYPNAEIYCMTSTARRETDYTGDNYPDAGQPTEYSAELQKVATHFGYPVIDLEYAIPKEIDIFDQYMGDKRAHPNALGMDQITNEVLSVMLGKESEICHVTSENNVVKEQAVLRGESYNKQLELQEGYSAIVTMDGKDITGEVCQNGAITIEKVTGNIHITVKRDEKNFRWELNNDVFDSVTGNGFSENKFTLTEGSIQNGNFSGVKGVLAENIYLYHDNPWCIEWACTGNWDATLFSNMDKSGVKGVEFLFRSSTEYELLAIGEHDGSRYNNYGIPTKELNLDMSQRHVYRLENKILDDGNMVWLYIDGTEIGPMNHHYIGSKQDTGNTSDWISGRDFEFKYVGSVVRAINNCNLEYIEVLEDGYTNETIAMKYDDHMDITGKTVEIIDAGKPISYQVGGTILDTAVITRDGEFLIATGIGNAKVKIDGTIYEVTVSPAYINIFMITGHSMGAGQQGATEKSVIVPDGQVYSSHGTTKLGKNTDGVGIGYAAINRPESIDAFTNAGSGTIGEGSALAWEYNRLTGEKVWVLNTAVGGSNLKEWIPGTTNYKNAVNQFQRAQAILANEIQAGHYILSNMGILYHNGANFSSKVPNVTQEDYQNWYNAMWSSFKTEMSQDMDGDGEKETVSFLGLIPIWTKKAGVSYTWDEPAGLYMAANKKHSDIFTASVIGQEWMTDANVASKFPEITYTTQDGAVIQRPITAGQVFSSDNVHYLQVGYNAVGIDIARNVKAYLEEDTKLSSFTFAHPNNLIEITGQIELNYGEEFIVIPLVEPISYSGLKFEIEGNIEITYPLAVKATGNGEGKLIAYDGEQSVGEIAFICNDASEKMSMKYDDRIDISGKLIEIIDAGSPTSYQVGYGVEENTVSDTAVVVLEGDSLVATGIGTAVVSIDNIEYEITVEAAPISMLFLIGQSNMQGSEGDANQSIICEDGMVYATYGDRYTMTVDNATNFAASALTGEYSSINVNGTTDNLSGYPIYSLNEAGAGKPGPDSGFAYEWVKQTGEKVWVVNAAHGGTSINVWQKNTQQYNEATALFTACQETMRKEIAAGHYTLSHMAYFWCQGCTDYSQTAEWYVNKYLAMHNNLNKQLSFDHDSDESTPDKKFEFAGIIPVRAGHDYFTSYREGVSDYTTSAKYHESFRDLRMTGPKVAQYWMGNNPELSDIWNVCNVGEDWVWMPDGTNGVSEYFEKHYENGTVDYRPQVKQATSWYTPTTPAAVHDSIHYNQIGYNEVGRESVRNALIMLGEIDAPELDTTITFTSWDGFTPVDKVTATTIGNSGTLVVPIVEPLWMAKKVSYDLSSSFTWKYYDVLAEDYRATGKLSVISMPDNGVDVEARELTSYSWEKEGNVLVSVGENENTITKLSGSVVDGKLIDTRYKFEKPLILLHDQNWILEWKMTGPWYDEASTTSKKFFCEDGSSATPNSMCLLISGTKERISIGYYGTTTHISYGVELGTYGISISDTHTYRLVNRINSDGSNMIYLFVDGKEIGPMSRYYTGSGGDMGEESNWLSGKDMAFGYMGTPNYLLDNGSIEYISVVEIDADADAHFHDWSEWTTVSVPSKDAYGVEKRICQGCFESQERKVEGVWQKFDFAAHFQEIPENVCSGTNLWTSLEHDTEYFASGEKWGTHSSKNVPSITIPVNEGDKIYATSFGASGANGGSSNGIRMTWFDDYGVVKTLAPADTYAEFSKKGYLTAPAGAKYINIPMWSDSDEWEVYNLSLEHKYDGVSCIGCGEKHPEAAKYEGKVISILGDSISTFAGYIPTADGFNLEHLARYPQDNLVTDVNETWWMQIINKLDAKLGINDSWRGSTVCGNASVTSGATGSDAAMSNLIRIQNLGSNGTPDVILFYGGTNDLAHISKVGTFDVSSAPTKVDLVTKSWDNLADGYVNTLLRLKYYYPEAEIISMLPTHTATYYSDTKLAQANDVLAQICEYYDVKYVDLRDSGVTKDYLPDGIHPGAEGMDMITNIVLNKLVTECDMTAGENVVHSVQHELTNVKASLGYYKGISDGNSFVETLTADNEIIVKVLMDGIDITEQCYSKGVISVEEVKGDLSIIAEAAFSLGDRLQTLPDNYYGTNLWSLLRHDDDYYSASGWAIHSSGKVKSVTIPVVPGERIYASSFTDSGMNGGTVSGIRVTFFDNKGVLVSMDATSVYEQFSQNGYITVPQNAVAVSIPMWTAADTWELYISDSASIPGFSLGEHLQKLPEYFCKKTNLWEVLEPEDVYFYKTKWDKLSSGEVYSVTVPVVAGEKLWATSFQAKVTNGGTRDGIRLTYFSDKGVLNSLDPDVVYDEFRENGYLTVPEDATAVNIVMWKNDADTKFYILSKDHSFNEWKSKEVPSASKKGTEERTCKLCDYSEMREVEGSWQKYNLADHLQSLPENLCCGTNIWEYLTPEKLMINHLGEWVSAGATVYSITIPINPGDKIYSNSFIEKGIQVSFIGNYEIVKTLFSADTKREFQNNGGYLVAPEGSIAVNIPVWNVNENNTVNILNYDHVQEIITVKPTCTEAGYTKIGCSYCEQGELTNVVEALGHKEVVQPSINATCTTDGLTEGSYCSSCGDTIVLQEIIPASHKKKEIASVIPSVDKTGLTSGLVCSECGEVFVKQEIIPVVNELKDYLRGKKVSILGDSISTYLGISDDINRNTYTAGNVAGYRDGGYYTNDNVTSVELTWWQQSINAFDMKLLVNHSSGSGRLLSTPSNGTLPAYYDEKCMNLHDNSGKNAGENPDIIAVYIGVNDGSGNKPAGSLSEIDFSKLISGTDETGYTYAIPETMAEGYAIMLHKMQNRYPDADIFLFTIPRQTSTISEYRTVIKEVATYYNEHVVDLYDSVLTKDGYANYFFDGVHPNADGMKIIAELFQQELYKLAEEYHLADTHKYDSVVSNPTCKEQGYTLHTCSVCNDNYKDTYVNATGHTLGYWQVVTPSTCTTEGLKQRECANCDLSETKVIPAKDHSYVAKITTATCTTNGFVTYICSRCNDSYIINTVDPTGHSLREWQVLSNATCETEGLKKRTCRNCDYFEVMTIPAIGHSYVMETIQPTCTEKGYNHYICEVCKHDYKDYFGEALGHEFSDWKEVIPSTCIVEGETHRECNRCDYIEVEVIPVIGHEFTLYISDNNATLDTDGTMTAQCNNCTTKDTIVQLGSKLEVIRLEITEKPSKLDYVKGETLELSDMVVVAYFDNGKSMDLQDYKVIGYNNREIGKQTVIISYKGKYDSFEVTVNKKPIENLSSSVYTVENHLIRKVVAGTTVNKFLGMMEDSDYIQVLQNNKEVSGKALIATGMFLKLYDGSQVKDSATVIVEGDVNGDGKITVTDMLMLKAHILGRQALLIPMKYAGDLNGDGNITITDYIMIRKYILMSVFY